MRCFRRSSEQNHPWVRFYGLYILCTDHLFAFDTLCMDHLSLAARAGDVCVVRGGGAYGDDLCVGDRGNKIIRAPVILRTNWNLTPKAKVNIRARPK